MRAPQATAVPFVPTMVPTLIQLQTGPSELQKSDLSESDYNLHDMDMSMYVIHMCRCNKLQ